VNSSWHKPGRLDLLNGSLGGATATTSPPRSWPWTTRSDRLRTAGGFRIAVSMF